MPANVPKTLYNTLAKVWEPGIFLWCGTSLRSYFDYITATYRCQEHIYASMYAVALPGNVPETRLVPLVHGKSCRDTDSQARNGLEPFPTWSVVTLASRWAIRGMVQDHSLRDRHEHGPFALGQFAEWFKTIPYVVGMSMGHSRWAIRGMVQDHSLRGRHEHGPFALGQFAEWFKTIPYVVGGEASMGLARNHPKELWVIVRINSCPYNAAYRAGRSSLTI